jgi:hypothetical protein
MKLEAVQDVSDTVEQLHKRIVTGANVLDSLKENEDFNATS